MTDKGLENLKKALRDARKAFAPPPAIDLPTGEENLRRALRVARKAFDPYDDREWLRRSDETCRAIMRFVGIEP
jgi:hypothetical protein